MITRADFAGRLHGIAAVADSAVARLLSPRNNMGDEIDPAGPVASACLDEIGIRLRDIRSLRSAALGLTPSQRGAIACGNEPYADDKICPTCGGRGHV